MAETVSNTPAILHVRVQQGDAWTMRVDANLNLTGYTFSAKVHPKDGSEDVVMAVTETNLASGIIDIDLTAAQSAALASDWHTWCLILTPGGSPSRPRTWIKGNFIIEVCE